MAAYSVFSKPSVERDLRRLPRGAVDRVMERIAALANKPFPRDAVKLSGAERLYRLRAGDYRIVYEVDTDAALITIHAVRHRRDVYRRLR